jgi:hypothetical protein
LLLFDINHAWGVASKVARREPRPYSMCERVDGSFAVCLKVEAVSAESMCCQLNLANILPGTWKGIEKDASHPTRSFIRPLRAMGLGYMPWVLETGQFVEMHIVTPQDAFDSACSTFMLSRGRGS